MDRGRRIPIGKHRGRYIVLSAMCAAGVGRTMKIMKAREEAGGWGWRASIQLRAFRVDAS